MNASRFLKLAAVIFLIMSLSLVFTLLGCKDAAETMEKDEKVVPAEEEVKEEVVEEDEVAESISYDDIEMNFGGEINALFLSGYGEEDAFKAFLDKYGVTLKATYFGTFDEAFNKIKTSAPGTYDLVNVNNAYVVPWVEAGILESLNLDLIPNWTNMYEVFQDEKLFGIEDGNKYVVPFTWGTNPMNFNSDFMEKPDSWMVTLDPELKNKVGIVDDASTLIYHAALINGFYDEAPQLLTQENLDKTIGFLRELLANSDKIAAGYGDLLTMFLSQDIYTAFIGWEYFSIASQEEGVPIDLTIPKEGSFSWCDTLAVVKDASNMDTAYGMVNQLISQDAETFWGNFLATGVTTSYALDGVDESLTKYFAYDDINNYLKNVAPMYNLPPSDSEEYTSFEDWVDAWNALKME